MGTIHYLNDRTGCIALNVIVADIVIFVVGVYRRNFDIFFRIGVIFNGNGAFADFENKILAAD